MTHSLKLFTLLLTLLWGGTSFGGSLQEEIDEILLQSGLASERLSIQIVSLPDGKVLYEKNPNHLLNPASNVKLVTAAAALHQLGPEYTFRTEVWSDSPIDRKGAINNLWIKGYGDPFFVTEELRSVVEQLRRAGLRRIGGKLFVDDGWFDDDSLITYSSNRDGQIYRTTTGALSFNFNRARPSNPAIGTGSALLRTLKRRGIFAPKVPVRGTVPDHARLLLTHHSPPLRIILKGLGKQSNNFMAEQLLKTIGAVDAGPPGSISKGRMVLKRYLTSLGLSERGFALDNGSGLSRLTRLSSSQLIRVLLDQYHQNFRDDLIQSLSQVGRDGTMRHKMRRSRLAGRVFAKTGSLNGVRALSGYLIEGPHLQGQAAFSFLLNDVSLPPGRIIRAEAKILELVMENL